jgi:hypothetical protein
MQMFLVFVIDYIATAIFYCCYGIYYRIICDTYIRLLLSDGLQPFLDIPNILAVCWLHLKNSLERQALSQKIENTDQDETFTHLKESLEG